MTDRDDEVSEDPFLDELFDVLVGAPAHARKARVDAALAERPDLAREISEAADLARDVVPRTLESSPHVPGFTIEGELGRGGMGRVLRARRKGGPRGSSGVDVALKVLDGPRAGSPWTRERFRSEARALARLRHPHVVAVHAVHEDPGQLCYSMELVEGPSLAGVISALGTAGPDRWGEVGPRLFPNAEPEPFGRFVARTGLAIARALAAVHSAGLLHRDVKPSNVLLERDGTPKLADFGVVHDPGTPGRTRTGEFLGTPEYAAPEQLEGSRVIDGRADVYALGASLFELVSGRRPYEGRSARERLTALENAPPPSVRRAGGVGRGLASVIETALEPSPDDRYGTAAEMADDLARVLAGERPRRRGQPVLHRLRRYLRRNRGLAVASAAGVVLGLAAAGLLAVRLHWMPQWAEQEILAARLELLNASFSEAVFVALEEVSAPEDEARLRDEEAEALRRYERALGHYDRALGWDSSNEVALRERAATRLAREILFGARPSDDGPRVEALRSHSRGAAHWSFPRVEVPPGHAELERDLGFVAYLVGDATSVLFYWPTPSPGASPDPLVDAALGQALLQLDRPGQAWVRLESAARTFGNAGFLWTDIADAALRIGEDAIARECLEHSGGMDRQNPFGKRTVLLGDLAAVSGDYEEAARTYRDVLSRHRSTRAFENLLAVERARGRLGEVGPYVQAFCSSLSGPDRSRISAWFLAEWLEESSSPARDLESRPWVRLVLLGIEDRTYFGSTLESPISHRITESANREEFAFAPRPEVALKDLPTTLELLRSEGFDAMNALKGLRTALLRSALHLDAKKPVRFLWNPVSPIRRITMTALSAAALPLGALAMMVSTVEAQSLHHKLDGQVPGGKIAWVVVELDDLNGDGVEDIGFRVAGEGSFRAVSGADPAQTLWTAPLATDGYWMPTDDFGTSAVRTADFDGDGISDVLVGATQQAGGGAGYVILVSGATGAAVPGTQVFGDSAQDRFGMCVDSGRDLDGDGVVDHLVGADQYPSGAGYVRVLSGASGGSLCKLTPTGQVGAQFGRSLSFTDDLDADGTSDFIVSAVKLNIGPVSNLLGRVWVYSGAAAAACSASPILGTVSPPSPGHTNFGLDAIGCPDLNGDGVGDFVVPERGYLATTGALHAFDGVSLARLWCWDGPFGGTYPRAVDWVTDVTGDGIVDFALGTSEASHPSLPGRVRLLSGVDGTQQWTWTHPLAGPGDRTGNSIANLGDLDGDGFDEIGVGAPWSDPSGILTDAGRMYIISSVCSAPLAYGTSKVNSQGCAPQIGHTGGKCSLTGPGPFDITCTDVLNNKFGLLFYGFCESNNPFQGGFKLVAAPTKRTPIQSSDGNPPPDDCSGTFSFDFNALARSGTVPGLFVHATVFAQYWYRDPQSPSTTGLSDALRFTIAP